MKNLKCPGSKIRSKGMGKGMGYGKGKGPIGIPRYSKSKIPKVITETEAKKRVSIWTETKKL